MIDEAARILKLGQPTLLILAGRALRPEALDYAGRIAGKTGCVVATQFFSARIDRGAGRVPTFRIPYAVDLALNALKGYRHLITVETGEPVAFFGYPNKPSLLKPEGCNVHNLSAPAIDSLEALRALADAVGAKASDAKVQQREDIALPKGALTAQSIAQILNVLIPENGIVVDESVTTGRESLQLTAGARPHTWLQNMGGSIGYGGPVATGAAVACPDRKVIALSGDGSAMYTIQCLWTQAREKLDVVNVIFANRAYQILRNEFAGVGAGAPGPKAMSMLSIDNPTLDFCAMAKGMGVEGRRVTTAEEFAAALTDTLKTRGPQLIEVVL